MKVLLKRFHLNGHTIGFHSQIQKLELHTKQIVPYESTAEEVSFELNVHTRGFHPHTQITRFVIDSGSELVNKFSIP